MADLPDTRTRLAELEKEYDEFMAQVKSRGYQSIEDYRPNNSDEEWMKKRLLAAGREIEDLRQRYTADLLRSIEASSKSLDQTAVKLKASTDSLVESSLKQAATTTELRKSSDRLNVVTDALLILTSVVAVAGSGSYTLQVATDNGLTAFQATALTGLVVVAVIVAIFVSFNALTGRQKKRETSLKGGSISKKEVDS